MSTVNPQRLTVSIPAVPKVGLDAATGVFHRFIQRHLVEGFVLDVADYRHVPHGPGMMIVGGEVDYGLTETAFSVTLKRLPDDAATQFRTAVRFLLGAVEQIDEDGALPTVFDRSAVTVVVADRRLGAADQVQQALLADIAPVAAEIFGAGTEVAAVTIEDPRSLPSVVVRAASVEGVLESLGGNQASRQSPWDVTVREVVRLQESGESFTLLDVREPGEFERVNIGGQLLPLGELGERLDELDKDAHVVVHCRAGYRGAKAVAQLRDAGFTNAWNVNGGLMAWADHIDPSLPKY